MKEETGVFTKGVGFTPSSKSPDTEEELRGLGLKLNKAPQKAETKFCYRIQKCAVTENNFLFLIHQKKQSLKK